MNVLAKFVQTLTLVAFAVHAVFGCCTHHKHGPLDEQCRDRGCASSSSLCSKHGSHHHGYEHLVLPSHQALTSKQTDVTDILVLDGECHLPVRCPRNCHESQCTFVTSSAKSLQTDGEQMKLDSSVSCARFDNLSNYRLSTPNGFEGRSLGTSSFDTCVRLQSWQI